MTDKFQSYRILHVEDEKLFIAMVKLMLNDKMFIIDNAENGSEAVDKAFKNTYDIILMDVFMPIMDGRVAAKTIKSMLPDLPIVALSACELSDLNGLPQFDHIIRKPVTKQLLWDSIVKIADEYIQFKNDKKKK
jgi:CheY-like chemotaxis protein